MIYRCVGCGRKFSLMEFCPPPKDWDILCDTRDGCEEGLCPGCALKDRREREETIVERLQRQGREALNDDQVRRGR